MKEKVAEYMRQYHMAEAKDHICVGISGGADSVCLFLILQKLQEELGFSMSVVHIEHGIRGEDSVRDMRFVQQLAEKYQIPVTCREFAVEQIAAEQGMSVEEAGRMVRYQTFEEEAKRYLPEIKQRGGSVKIALAHHADDNAETMIFHLCRGSGLEGLAGIRPVRGQVIRPLLCVTRQEIEAYLLGQNQAYCTDITNTDTAYSRNRIRNCVMPELNQINCQSVAHMNRLAENVAELSDYMGGIVEDIILRGMERQKEGVIFFAVKHLQGYPQVIQSRVMLELIAAAAGSRKDISREHAWQLLETAKGKVGRKLSLPYGLQAEKTYHAIRIYPVQSREKPGGYRYLFLPAKERDRESCGEVVTAYGIFTYRIFEYTKKDGKIPQNQCTKWFDYDMIKSGLSLRTREPGDYFCLDEDGHRQKLKNYWMNEKVPRNQRNETLLLADGSHILWIVGGRISAYYKITEHTKTILEVKYREDEHE